MSDRTGGEAFLALVRRTPLVPAPALEDELGRPIWLKLECLQRTGSFKLRGAALRLDALAESERRRGVVAASAGNHGLGVALAGAHLGIDTTVFVPSTSPAVKRDGIARSGARVEVAGDSYDAAELVARERAASTGAVFVSPFDDPDVIAGNGGSLGDEIASQRSDLARVVCPVGGGGLVSGLAAALAPRGVDVVGAQPENNCAMYRSLEAGRAFTTYDGDQTIAEGCEGAVAERTFELCREHQVSIGLVSEAAIVAAIAFAYRRLGVVVEPSSAVALAALRTGSVELAASGATVVVLTGGNVAPEVLDRALATK